MRQCSLTLQRLLLCYKSRNLNTKRRTHAHAAVKGLQELYKQLLEALPAPNSNRRLNQTVNFQVKNVTLCE